MDQATNSEQTGQPPTFCRDGPRPLGLHLATAAATWMSSAAASASLRTAWPHWNATATGDLTDQFNALRAALADRAAPSAGFDPFAMAVAEAGLRRMNRLLSGILAYRRHPYRRRVPAVAEVWRDGPARLLDYAPDATGPPLFVVPSLINRAYIVDIQAARSFVRWLAARGFRPLVLDWGAPDAATRDMSLTDMIAGRLESALTHARTLTGQPVTLVGYCMGGTLAVALAQRRPDAVAALVCIAAPWNFAADAPAAAGLIQMARPALETVMAGQGVLPVDYVQALFHALDPMLVTGKFLKFDKLRQDGAAARDFVALEDWLNDGVDLPAPVARECLFGWYAENTPAEGAWRIAGTVVDPAKLAMPCLLAIPSRDRIVPPASALALGAAIPAAEVLRLPLGHIGMMASRRAPAQAWTPIAAWLTRQLK